ncbi:MAG: 23S rRNA (guanosine(2251)-2'-O)-methyltransferase RlmB [Deltaproteobacteria bacterium]|nr:23S rRNA (guanosine(2251)-2'-O)-methyltransferase RlmB [Deltaproteobacteria bacterium]
MSTDILSGGHAVLECLRARRRAVHEIWATAEWARALGELRAGPAKGAVAAELRRLAGTDRHQGIVARVGPYPYVTLEAILDYAAADATGPLLLLLDQIQDPQNLGAILRTAEGMGAHGVLLPKDNAVGVTPTVVRASAGAVEHLRIAQVTNLSRAIRELQSRNIWVVGAAAEGQQSVFDYQFAGGHALVLGAEGKGMRRLVRESCDTVVHIPMAGRVTSYNVSVAAALLLSEAVRQRRQKSENTCNIP